MKQRLHCEVRPFPLITVLCCGTVLSLLDIEAVLAQLLNLYLLLLLGLSRLLIGDAFLVVHGTAPQSLLLITHLGQFIYEHRLLRIRLHQGDQSGQFRHHCCLGFRRLSFLEAQLSQPQYEIAFFKPLEAPHRLTVLVRILLLPILAERNGFHRYCESSLHGSFAVLDNGIHASSEVLTRLHWVGIRKEANLMCDASKLLELIIRPCRTERSHRIRHADLLKPHAVRRPLNGIHFLFLSSNTSCRMEAEQHVPFPIYGTLATVEVFRLRQPRQIPSRITDDMPHAAFNRNHYPLTEEVVPPVLLIHANEAERTQAIQALAVLLRPFHENVSLRRISDTLFFAVVSSPSPVSIFLRSGILPEHRLIERVHTCHQPEVRLPFKAAVPLLIRFLPFLYPDIRPVSQDFHGGRELQPIVLHHKADGITALPAPVALIGTPHFIHHERGCPLPMERAATLTVLTSAVRQRNAVLLDEIHDACPVKHVFYDSLRYHLITCLSITTSKNATDGGLHSWPAVDFSLIHAPSKRELNKSFSLIYHILPFFTAPFISFAANFRFTSLTERPSFCATCSAVKKLYLSALCFISSTMRWARVFSSILLSIAHLLSIGTHQPDCDDHILIVDLVPHAHTLHLSFRPIPPEDDGRHRMTLIPATEPSEFHPVRPELSQPPCLVLNCFHLVCELYNVCWLFAVAHITCFRLFKPPLRD